MDFVSTWVVRHSLLLCHYPWIVKLIFSHCHIYFNDRKRDTPARSRMKQSMIWFTITILNITHEVFLYEPLLQKYTWSVKPWTLVDFLSINRLDIFCHVIHIKWYDTYTCVIPCKFSYHTINTNRGMMLANNHNIFLSKYAIWLR